MDYGKSVGKYEGDFKGGKRHGFGTMYYSDGRKWEGRWDRDAFKGGITTVIPYHPADTLRVAGMSDSNPFTDALYRIIACTPDKFTLLKADKTGTELGQYGIWNTKVMLPLAKRGEIREKTQECRYYFAEKVEASVADKLFDDISRYIQFSNPRTWKFDDITPNPAFPYHRKLYKWTIATPTTLRLEVRQTHTNSTLYDVYLAVTL
jgi:hypothetical protein